MKRVYFPTRKERRNALLISSLCYAKIAVCLFKSHRLNFNCLKPDITKLNHSKLSVLKPSGLKILKPFKHRQRNPTLHK